MQSSREHVTAKTSRREIKEVFEAHQLVTNSALSRPGKRFAKKTILYPSLSNAKSSLFRDNDLRSVSSDSKPSARVRSPDETRKIKWESTTAESSSVRTKHLKKSSAKRERGGILINQGSRDFVSSASANISNANSKIERRGREKKGNTEERGN